MASFRSLVAFIAVCAVAVVSGVSAYTFDPKAFSRRVAITAGAELYWQLDAAGTTITFALAAPTTTGWIGLGIGETASGSMAGADMAIVTINDATGVMTVGDYFSTDFGTPAIDCHSQDWTSIGWTRNATSTVAVFSRLLAAANVKEDREIADTMNALPFLFAYGATQAFTYHGLNRRAMFAARIFSAVDPLAQVAGDANTFTQDWVNKNYEVPAYTTTYQLTPCANAPAASSSTGQLPYMVAFDPIVDTPIPGFVHHMVAKGYSGAKCSGTETDIFAIASAAVPFVLPADVGLKMVFKSFSVQIHYNNPNLTVGMRDSSGIRAYFSYAPRKFEAGVLQLADPRVRTRSFIQPGITRATYGCPSSCTMLWQENITVFADLLHMHQVGMSMWSSFALPSGNTITREVEYYSFHNQQNRFFDRIVLPRGTKASTTCIWNLDPSVTGLNIVGFGPSSSNEMCIHFLYYYPIQDGVSTGSNCGLGYCGGLEAFVSNQKPAARVFGTDCATPAPPPSWTPPPATPSPPNNNMGLPGSVSSALDLRGFSALGFAMAVLLLLLVA